MDDQFIINTSSCLRSTRMPIHSGKHPYYAHFFVRKVALAIVKPISASGPDFALSGRVPTSVPKLYRTRSSSVSLANPNLVFSSESFMALFNVSSKSRTDWNSRQVPD